ncbi:surface antigen BspA-like [Trichomonas vaginalis G3]|uniref:Surface antigen BspA-like n=1 Tax=Trichomonas vaginalis (strain ATCC PRA-98 / G3) TaxID=412133 RepID=A2FDX2_TRIV3|nr:surface antigen family [Trichomonas vaginalis G3]EAX96890.1 surface antigen BspA-like [Trichomonas vaginalis G3]KAI5551324.1 surface antigen family [Trichomonas vaginalis G3]|eukprot:XP_001309820.1 surface antigen BspA-like [Trichomonas vaginalis G3]
MSSCTELTFLNYALFYQCKKLRSIILPPNLNRIGSACFQETFSLTEITFPDSLTSIDGWTTFGKVFYNSGLVRVNINRNSNLAYIGGDVFADCKFTSFFIPWKCTSIDGSTFSGCPLTEIIIDERNPTFKTDGKIIYSGTNNNTLFFVVSTKTGSFTVPEYVTVISYSAFRGSKLTEINMHKKITKINSWSMCGCPIASFTFPSLVTYVADNMFYLCTSLVTVYLTENITSIQDGAFLYCYSLKNIVLPSKLREIGKEAFSNCFSLTHISLPESLQTLGDGAFSSIDNIIIDSQNPNIVVDGFSMYTDKNQTLFIYLGSNQDSIVRIKSECNYIAAQTFLMKKFKHVYFENNDSMTIGASAFANSYIQSIEMPPGLKKIEGKAFAACHNLENVTFLGNQLKSIPDSCFIDAYNLKYITLPKSIESIGNYAFQSCTNLKNLGIATLNSLTSIGIAAFMWSGITSVRLSDSVSTIGSAAFNASKITDLSICCNISQMMCQYCTSLTTLELRGGVCEINIYAFKGCSSLTGFTIPQTLHFIKSFAFQDCDSLNDVSMATNGNLQTIEGGCCSNCISLKEIKLSQYEENFSFYNGALMNFNQTQLIVFIPYSDIKNFVVPTDTEVIGSNAFMGSPRLLRVFFSGNKINRINYQAFKNCRSLSLVFFSSSKIEVSFGSDVFSGCINLRSCGTFSAPRAVKETLISQGIPSIAFNDDCDTSVTCKIRHEFKISATYLTPFILM